MYIYFLFVSSIYCCGYRCRGGQKRGLYFQKERKKKIKKFRVHTHVFFEVIFIPTSWNEFEELK